MISLRTHLEKRSSGGRVLRWFPPNNRFDLGVHGALAVKNFGLGLDDQATANVEQSRGSTVVAIGSRMEQPRDRNGASTGCCGGPPRTRTLDPLIKSQLLYHLS